MKARASFLISIPVALAGSLLAHQVAYSLRSPSEAALARLLAVTGHGYLRHVGPFLASLAAVAIVGLVREAVVHWRGGARRALMWPVALIPPVAFVVQEHLERVLHGGGFPWHLAAEPSFLFGLALQIPFALLALGLATTVAGTVRRAVDTLRDRARSAALARPLLGSRATAGPRALRVFLGTSESLRAPPSLLA